MIQMENEQYLLGEEAARFLGVSHVKFHTDCKKRLQRYRVGILRRWYYKQSELMEINKVRPDRPQSSVMLQEVTPEFVLERINRSADARQGECFPHHPSELAHTQAY